MLARPFISRRGLLTGAAAAAAFAALPRDARATTSNASAWDSGNKGTNVALSDHYYFGTNTIATKTAGGAAYESVRSLTSAATSSGTLVYFEAISRLVTGSGSLFIGVGNSSVSTSNFVGNNSSGRGWYQNADGLGGAAGNYYNNGSTGSAPLWKQATLVGVFLDLQNNRWSFTKDKGVTWYKENNTTISDPLTDGTALAFTGTTYFWASLYNNNSTTVLWNGGGWPFVGAKPTGAVGLDPSYPGSISKLTIYWSDVYSGFATSQNDMRVASNTTAVGAIKAVRANKAIPDGTLVAWDTIIESGIDSTSGAGSLQGGYVGILDTSADVQTVADGSASSAIYLSNGSYSVASGGPSGGAGTLPTYQVGDIITTAVKWVSGNRYIWWSVNGGNWNGNASADPGANTTGAISLSTIAGLTVAPVVNMVANSKLPCLSANFGATTLSRSLPTGFQTLEAAAAAASGGAYHIFGQNSPIGNRLRALLAA